MVLGLVGTVSGTGAKRRRRRRGGEAMAGEAGSVLEVGEGAGAGVMTSVAGGAMTGVELEMSVGTWP